MARGVDVSPITTQLVVELGDNSYPIWVGSGLLADAKTSAGLLSAKLRSSQVVVVSNDTVAPLYMETLLRCLDGYAVDQFLLPDGEANKNLDNFTALLDFMLARKHNRSTAVIALGGGVVGDLAGFAAACYQRGVNFLQVPTTLLAQVDSSVGGKTAVNHPLGKNMIGAFYQPSCVLIDTATLETLPHREYLAGLAEVLKYGVIYDLEFFDWLGDNLEALLARDPEVLTKTIVESCRIKAAVVGADEREQGLRAILNYGHTFAHALENLAGYGNLLHGEAVAIGMVQAADLAVRLGLFALAEAKRVKALIRAAGLPVGPPPGLATSDLIAAMALDKKTIDGTLRFILPSAIGAVHVHNLTDDSALRATLEAGSGLCEVAVNPQVDSGPDGAQNREARQ